MAYNSGRNMRQFIEREVVPEYFELDLMDQGQIRFGLHKAAGDLESHSYPEALTDTVGYEGVDPDGMYCKENLDYIHRMQQIQLRAQMYYPNQNEQDFLKSVNFFKGAAEIQPDELEYSENKRLYRRAAGIAATDTARDILLDCAEKEGEEVFQERTLYLEAMEYAMGIRTEPITEAHKEATRSRAGGLAVQSLESMAEHTHAHPPKYFGDDLTIKFANFDTTLQQRYLAHPRNHGKSVENAPTDYKNPQVAEANAMAYAKASVAPTIDMLFQDVETKLGTTNLQYSLNRGSMIVVNGKTIAEHMAEVADPTLTQDGYKAWYQENLRDKTNELVGAALASGGQVHFYPPDEYGDLPKQPINVVREGYEPSPLKPVTMHGWQRFLNRMGMFKDKKLAADNYEAEVQRRAEADQAMKLAGDRVQATGVYGKNHQGSGFLAESQFYDEPITTSFGTTGLRVGRTAHVTGPRSILLSQGYSAEDVFDKTKLLEEKKAAGQTYIDMAKNPTEENCKKIGEVYAKATVTMEQYMEERHKTVDFTDIRQESDHATLRGMAQYMHDMFQERGGANVYHHYLQSRLPDVEVPDFSQEKDPTKAIKDFDDAHIEPIDALYYNFYDVVSKRDLAMLDTKPGNLFTGQMSRILGEEMSCSTISSRMAEKPGAKLTEVVNGEELTLINAQATVSAAMMSGKLQLTMDQDVAFANEMRAGVLRDKLITTSLVVPEGLEQAERMNVIFGILDKVGDGLEKNVFSRPAYAPPAPEAEPASKKIGLQGLTTPKTQEPPKHKNTKSASASSIKKDNPQKGGRGM